MIRDPLVFVRTKEFTIQPPQVVQLVSERDLSQNGSDEVDGEGLLIGICTHDLLNSEGRQGPLRKRDNALIESRTRTLRAVDTGPSSSSTRRWRI